MRRWIAIASHASFLALAAALYVLFVLPRWFELTGAWPVGLGQPMRIVDGVLIGLAALPVVFTYLHTRKPEFGNPQLALSLRLWSIVLHVLAGVLVVGAAIAEFWVSLDRGGQWLFGSYGAAAALAVLGAVGFYLAYLAELPPPPPKPLKPKVNRRGRTAGDEDTDDADDTADTADTTDSTEEDAAEDTVTVEADENAASEPSEPPVFVSSLEDDAESGTSDEPGDEADGKLKNRRPAAKTGARRFLRRRGGVAVDE